jgi:hypothetical protein
LPWQACFLLNTPVFPGCNRRINLYPVGIESVPKSLHAYCEGTGLQGDGTHLLRGVLQPSDETITHPPWKRYILFVLFAAFLFALENRAFRYDAGLEIAPKRDQ